MTVLHDLYTYKGKTRGFYKKGEKYWLELQVRRFFKPKVTVFAVRGGHDTKYPDAPVLYYSDMGKFREEWDEQTST